MPQQKVPGCHSGDVLRAPVLIVVVGIAIFATLAFLAQVFSIAVQGLTSDAGLVYVALVAVLAIGTWLSAVLLRRSIVSPKQIVHAHAWTSMVIVTGMVVADWLVGGSGFPMVLTMLCVGGFLLGILCGWRMMLPYSVVSAALMLAAGAIYCDMGDAVATVLAVGLTDLSAVAVDALIAAKTRRVVDQVFAERRRADEAQEAADVLQRAIEITANGRDPATLEDVRADAPGSH